MSLPDKYAALKQANQLPTPPSTAIRVLELVESEHASMEALAEVVSSDPALAAKILKFINSPLVGLSSRGITLQEAISHIGMRGAQMMALSFSIISKKQRVSCPSFDFDCFWSESLARAVAARVLARQLKGWDPEEAFITGLLARVGQLAFATGMPEEYEAVFASTSGDARPLEAREQAVLGTDHLELGSQLLRDWRLPDVVWKTAALLAAGKDRPNRSAQVIEVADDIAAFLATNERHTAEGVNALAAHALERLEIGDTDFREMLGQVSEQWISYGHLLTVRTPPPPELAAIEGRAEEHRTALRLASELEVKGLKVENAKLDRLARRDRLTGLLNRGAFDKALPDAVQECRKSGRPLAVLMIDADHFKAVNDTHGHPAGDAVLTHLARLLDDNARKRDQIFRYGGEEFAVIAPDCAAEAAHALAESFRASVAEAPCMHDKKSIPMTVSIGIAWAQWPDQPTTVKELVEYADARLYDAKHAGRNTTCITPAGRRTGGIVGAIKRLFGDRS